MRTVYLVWWLGRTSGAVKGLHSIVATEAAAQALATELNKGETAGRFVVDSWHIDDYSVKPEVK